MKAYVQNGPKDASLHIYTFEGDLFYAGTPEWVDLPRAKTARIQTKTERPDKQEWLERVGRAKSLPKVVLARQVQLELDHAPDPFALTASLPMPGAHLFCFEHEGEAFFGATPERLFWQEGNTFYTEAIAGTRPRGKTAEEDAIYRNELLQSPKERSEFLFVQDYLKEHGFAFSPLQVRKTPNVQHLYARGESFQKPSLSLHPTPALCGTPKEKALQLIEELEPPRGLYGGIFLYNNTALVMIRCCHLKKNIATLYAGAGIVESSDGEAEWEETAQKMRLYDRVLVG